MSPTTQRLRELLAAATPGPWHTNGPDFPEEVYDPGRDFVVAYCREFYYPPAAHGESPDAALIAALRNSAPALLDRVEALERALKRLCHAAPDPAWALTAALADDSDPPSMIVAASNEYVEALG